jgi:hypothetical protein
MGICFSDNYTEYRPSMDQKVDEMLFKPGEGPRILECKRIKYLQKITDNGYYTNLYELNYLKKTHEKCINKCIFTELENELDNDTIIFKKI